MASFIRARSLGLLASVIAVTATGTVAVSSAISADDPINGCVSKLGGGVRVIDPQTQTCGALEDPISWNRSGPAGPKGDRGLQGPQGPAGPTGQAASWLDNHPAYISLYESMRDELELSAWDVPAGSYRIDGRSTIYAKSSTNPQQQYVRCSIRAGTTVLKQIKVPAMPPYNSEAIALQAVVKLNAPTHLNLACIPVQITLGGDAGASATTFEITGLGVTRGL